MQEQDYISLSDEALIGVLFDLAGRVDPEEVDELDAALSEGLERWAPEALKRQMWEALRDDEAEEAAFEMDAWLAAVESRAAFRPLAQQLA